MWYGYIYKTTCLQNGLIYVGKRIFRKDLEKPNRVYLGSGKILKLAIKKYGKANFSKEIIVCCKDRNTLNEQERFWIKYFNSNSEAIGYNLTEGGDWGEVYFDRMPNGREIIEKRSKKISESLRGVPHTEERNAGKSNSWNNQPSACCLFCRRISKVSIIKKHVHDCLKNPNRVQLIRHTEESKSKFGFHGREHSTDTIGKMKSLKWWINTVTNQKTKSENCPGENWIKGRKYEKTNSRISN